MAFTLIPINLDDMPFKLRCDTSLELCEFMDMLKLKLNAAQLAKHKPAKAEKGKVTRRYVFKNAKNKAAAKSMKVKDVGKLNKAIYDKFIAEETFTYKGKGGVLNAKRDAQLAALVMVGNDIPVGMANGKGYDTRREIAKLFKVTYKQVTESVRASSMCKQKKAKGRYHLTKKGKDTLKQMCEISGLGDAILNVVEYVLHSRASKKPVPVTA